MPKVNLRRRVAGLTGAAVAAVLATSVGLTGNADASSKYKEFDMVRSGASEKANCLVDAQAKVRIVSTGPVEIMTVDARNLPANTDFDFFVTQVPDTPFGISWYQGDLESGSNGRAHGVFVGRFNIETFAVAPNTAPAPTVFDGPFPSASSNPPFGPVQMYHLGFWFNSPEEAKAAGCLDTVTPFNGEHNAGVQAMSTRNFPIDAGPLRDLEP